MSQNKHSLLWEISKPTQDQHFSYLFGTMHVKSALAFRQIDQVKALIATCEVFAAELPIDEVHFHPAFGHVFLSNPNNQLKANLSEARYQKIQKQILRAVQIDLDALNHIRPMIISNMIDEAMMPAGTAPYALDETLWRYAKDLGKSTIGLETVENQIAVLQSIDPKEELRTFLSAVKNINRHRTHIQKILHWYETAQVQQLYKSSYQSLGAWRNLLLKKRNLLMVRQLVEQLGQQRVFAAVGAAHLSGQFGILRGLKKAGFRVAPLRPLT